LKLLSIGLSTELVTVETLRKPSTGLKLDTFVTGPIDPPVETLRKPSTGLKHCHADGLVFESGRDTQKTQHGIETEP